MDCVNLFTFYVAILSVMVEVNRIKTVRRLQPTRKGKAAPDSPTSISPSSSTGSILYSDQPMTVSMASSIRSLLKSLKKRASGFGVISSGDASELKDLAKAESPAGRLKLCLVS